jgi:hemerythrin-like domain-containing protein
MIGSMDTNRQTGRALHDEHVATLELLGRTERALGSLPPDGAPGDALLRAVAELDRHVRIDVDRHFGFEERELFPRMVEGNEGDMAALLKDEHDTMREVAAELLPLTLAAAAGTLDAAGWKALQRLALELSVQLGAHIEKEERGLLPLMEDLIDDDTDRELALAYASL